MHKFIYHFIFCFLFTFSAFSQHAATIKGTVTTSDGKVAPYVNIIIKNSIKGTSTGTDGKYKLKLASGEYVVIASIIGFEAQEKVASLKPGEALTIDFVLNESSKQLQEVTVNGVRAITGMGYLNEVNDNVLYSGKKTEVILLDSLDANTAQNNPRQVLGRVPGANYSETEGSGFPSNGIAFRGLNPSQSIETNTRQNGYNITGDLYGYPESYYLPPLEAVDRIEVTRGASSLQFGPQFGGVINYILKRGNKNTPFEITTQLTGGSFGMMNSYNSVGGQKGGFNYFGYVQYQSTQGWRPNSDFRKVSGYGRLEYEVNNKLKLAAEYSILRNRIHMPGGFTDQQFTDNPRASYRARNWLKSPWNIITLSAEYKISPSSSIVIKNTTNFSARDLVWRNEDGGPAAPDNIDPVTNDFVNREVEHEDFKSNTTEARLLVNYKLGNTKNTVAAGIRYFTGKMKREGGGKGTTSSDFDLSLVEPKYEYALDFTTFSLAPFIENTFRLGDRLSVTPGLRYEYINSTVKGYNPSDVEEGTVYSDRSKNRYIFLAGIGLQYKTSRTTNIYGNISQAYRPMDYSTLTPLGTIATVDPNLKDASGYNADLGFRGSVMDFLNFDIGAFYLQYNNRIGTIDKNGSPYRTVIGNSVHQGVETYIEINPIKAFSDIDHWDLSFFNSLAIINAKYVSGFYSGNYVEYAPTYINRFGANAHIKRFSTTFLISSTAKSFGDATNTVVPSDDPVVGAIPSYTVMDWSATLKIKNFNIKGGINNLADKMYFTKRTDEYPGPGIIPSIGRSFYIGLGARF